MARTGPGSWTFLTNHAHTLICLARKPDAELRTSANAAFVQNVAIENVNLAVEAMLARSEVLAEMEKAGEIDAVGAMYDVGSGEVRFLSRR